MSEQRVQGRGIRWSVRARILATVLVIAGLGMVVAGASAFLLQRERAVGAIDDRLTARVETARSLLTGGSAPADTDADAVLPTVGPFDDADEALAILMTYLVPARNEGTFGIVSDALRFTPSVVVDVHPETFPGFVDRIVRETGDERVVLGSVVHDGHEYRYLAAPVVVEQELLDEKTPERSIWVDVVDVTAEVAPLTSAFSTYAGVAALALVVIGAVAWFVAGRLLRPLRLLRRAAARITASDLAERIPVVGRDDVSDLTVTVNGMLARLDEAMAAQRRLLDDVRHELKTPITIVRGHLDVMDPTDAEDVAGVKALAVDELDRMTALVDDIAALAEVELAPDRRMTDVAELTTDVFAKASVISGHAWELESTAVGRVPLDARRITQAWLQLADNAAKYSPAGTTVRIGSEDRADGVELWVADAGPGVPPDAIERIFERFGRVDTRRGIRGSGLGLPIVRAIAVAHGGSVTVRTGPEGSRFGIRLPSSDEARTQEVPVIRS